MATAVVTFQVEGKLVELAVTPSRARRLQGERALTDREYRSFVRAGAVEPTAEDLQRITRAKLKILSRQLKHSTLEKVDG